jgi:dTDP-glucose pyrophosphorylase
MSDKPLYETSTLLDAIHAIELTEKRATVIVNNENKLLGTITDGDIRRKFLAGGSIGDLAIKAMNSDPIKALIGSSNELLIDLMKKKNILIIPIVSKENVFIELMHLKDMHMINNHNLFKSFTYEFAVIMAGGEGNRLRPITSKIPKPMVEVGGVPIIERQIKSLSQIGISKVYLSVNYLSEKIEEYFGDGKDFGIEVIYLKEQNKMGTVGSLSLITTSPTSPILILNGDIFTNSNFNSLLEFHNNTNAEITIATTNYTIEIPYGVIGIKNEKVIEILEKPSQKFLCNAGIYSVSPKAFKLVKKFRLQNMTDLINLLLSKKMKVSAFPIHEYWIDIGTPEDLKKARDFYNSQNFPK